MRHLTQEEIDKYLLETRNAHALILPKLRALANSGDGAIIHDANSWIGRITGWESLYNYYSDLPHLVTWREYIRSAELWMIEKAKETR